MARPVLIASYPLATSQIPLVPDRKTHSSMMNDGSLSLAKEMKEKSTESTTVQTGRTTPKQYNSPLKVLTEVFRFTTVHEGADRSISIVSAP